MSEAGSATDKIRAVLVILATVGMIAFNWLAAAGRVNGVTPAEVSNTYPTNITPSGYAFSIWSLIYLGVAVFSIYQLLPRNAARFRGLRSLYITSCGLNCAWIYFWQMGQIAVCFALIVGLLAVLLIICSKVRPPDSVADSAILKFPFGIYAGWVTAAALVNFSVLLVYEKVDIGSWANILGVAAHFVCGRGRRYCSNSSRELLLSACSSMGADGDRNKTKRADLDRFCCRGRRYCLPDRDT